MTDTWRRDGVNLWLGDEGFTVFLDGPNMTCAAEGGAFVERLIGEANKARGSDAPAAWKAETCETCEFQVVGLCRVGPPTIEASPAGYCDNYPVVIADSSQPDLIRIACAQWRRAATTEDTISVDELVVDTTQLLHDGGPGRELNEERSNAV